MAGFRGPHWREQLCTALDHRLSAAEGLRYSLSNSAISVAYSSDTGYAGLRRIVSETGSHYVVQDGLELSCSPGGFELVAFLLP